MFPFLHVLRNPGRVLRHTLQQVCDRNLTVWPLIGVVGRSVTMASALITGTFLGIQFLGGLEPLELYAFDRLIQLQPDVPIEDPRLLLVCITEDDLKRYGWPLPDQVLAAALSQLQAHHPRVIGLDLYRDIPNPPGELALATQLQADNLITITNVASGILPPPEVEADRVGFNDFTLDPDGVLRRNLLFVPTDEQDYYSFALRVSLAYLSPQAISFRVTPEAIWLGNYPIPALEPWVGGYQSADARGYQTLLNYRTRHTLAQSVSLSQVLEGSVPAEQIRNQVVLIGTTAFSLKDFLYTPYSSGQDDTFQMPGVIIHAHMVSQLLDIGTGTPALFRSWPQWGEILWLWGWTVIGGLLVWVCRNPLTLLGAGVIGVLVLGGTSGLLLAHLIWIPVVEPMLGLVSTMVVVMGYRVLYTTTRDARTGLLTRDALVRHLTHTLARPVRCPEAHPLGVMFLTLDRLHLIRKSLGDAMGDRLILMVIQRWRSVLPRAAQLAWVGGDEFAIALPPTSTDTLTAIADRLQGTLATPFLLKQHPIVATARIGIAVTQSQHQHTPENLLRDAHTAMYRAKALGQEHYEVFAAGMLTEVVEQFTLETDLRQGIQTEDFVVYYQPIMVLSTGQITGFEALVRWQHPQRGTISPQTFIPLAEETGLIVALGEWVCHTACQQLYQWQKQFPNLPLTMSINLSGRQFDHPDLIGQLAQVIQSTSIEGTTLKLEITESMVMGSVEAVIDLMLRLKSLGCKLSLDDFGTGYSSLSHLRRFPVDTLKVDKSFVQRMGDSHEDDEIVHMIVRLAHTLGMDVVAEGIETVDQAERLRLINCEFGQGYLWSKPLSAQQATAFLQQYL